MIIMVTQAEILELLGVDFRRFIYDQFLSTEQISEAITQTAEVTRNLCELQLSTGVQQDSECRIYYTKANFNPWYSTLIFKANLSDITDTLAFFGMKQSTSNPAWDMAESHAGFFIYEDGLYASVADGDNQQTIKLTGWTPTNNLLYKIVQNRFSLRPLPIIYPYFDGFRYEKPKRVWSPETTLSSYPPLNQDHYFVAYIKNSTGYTKVLRIKHILYGEEYAD